MRIQALEDEGVIEVVTEGSTKQLNWRATP
jgi:hypothetical protein